MVYFIQTDTVQHHVQLQLQETILYLIRPKTMLTRDGNKNARNTVSTTLSRKKNEYTLMKKSKKFAIDHSIDQEKRGFMRTFFFKLFR